MTFLQPFDERHPPDNRRLSLGRRASKDLASLSNEQRWQNRGVGLREVAPYIGLILQDTAHGHCLSGTSDSGATESILTSPVEYDEDTTYDLSLKIEPRKSGRHC